MKATIYVIIILILVSCSSVKMTDTWVDKELIISKPKKVLVVGLTDNLTARKIFEEQLKTKLKNRGIEAIESYNVFKPTFTSLKQTEEDIQNEIVKLTNDGFDAILISAVKGVDEKESYSGDKYIVDYYWRGFGLYYFLYQDVYLTEGYYEKYKVYHIESSLYNLKTKDEKSLVWVASYDLVDPKKINSSVSKYVKAIINALEKEQIIPNKL
ncbi:MULTISPECIES: hypothetical protein [Winogradskyella]|uniref:Cardiolipin synthetase n=2 Tax=Winogradskyella TaxID=286104 RepID=A0A1G8JC54_9FLAO|nr:MULTISPECIES: hypothetical protein [Winogradskyella]REE07728.1 hypothetical protein DFQ09_11158 [Winogradskyella pacifica]SDI28854.1 hypothetical protein SAMN04489796_10944 [Winogradskyella thalassocola]